jgi:hypothetical protein
VAPHFSCIKFYSIILNVKKPNNKTPIRSSSAEYLTFIAATGDDAQSFEMRYEDENIWLTQKLMAGLYDVSVSAINQHLKTLASDNEIDDAVIKKYLITATDGKPTYPHDHARLG